jgi:hypothetical protein
MRIVLVVALVATAACPALAEWVQVMSEDFEGRTVVRLEGAAQFAPGRDEQALKLSGDGRVVLSDAECPHGAGRIQMDVCPTQTIPPRTDGRHWLLLTDVGAGSAWQGATVVYFDRDTAQLRYGVFDGGWHWLDAAGVEWTPGQWRQVAFTWGPKGRTLEVDGREVARDSYADGIHARTLQLGYFDGYSEARAAAFYEATLADLQSLGVDTLIANWTPRAHRRLLLDSAQRHGIRVIVHLDEVNNFIWDPRKFAQEDCVAAFRSAIAEVSGHPATAGYYLVDEPAPTAENIANIRLCRRIVEALDPAHPGFSCLNTGWDVIFPQVGYQVLLVDIYPLYSSHLTGDTLRGYLGALDAAHAAGVGAPLWLIPQNFGFKPRPESIPGPNEVTLLCWEALARGAKGLIHFIYQSTTEIQGERLAGIGPRRCPPASGPVRFQDTVGQECTDSPRARRTYTLTLHVLRAA